MFRGLTRGLQQMADFLRLLFKVVAATPEIAPFAAVANQWLKETISEVTGAVKVNPWSLMMNGDPWKGSRAMWQDLQKLYDKDGRRLPPPSGPGK